MSISSCGVWCVCNECEMRIRILSKALSNKWSFTNTSYGIYQQLLITKLNEEWGCSWVYIAKYICWERDSSRKLRPLLSILPLPLSLSPSSLPLSSSTLVCLWMMPMAHWSSLSLSLNRSILDLPYSIDNERLPYSNSLPLNRCRTSFS